MAHIINKNSNRYKKRYKGLASSSYVASNPDSSVTEFYELEAAEVVDVIRGEDHPNFLNWRDVGKVKIRMVNSEYNKREEELLWVQPMDPNIKSYPLIHEIVVVVQYLGNWFYSSRINYLNSINHNEAPYISIDFRKFNNQNKSQNYEQRAAGNTNSDELKRSPELGENFERDPTVKPLKHYEGDLVVEGRFGNSIRFGSNQETLNPLIKIRAGQYQEAENLEFFQTIEEDINLDASSLYLAEDQVFQLEPVTQENESHYYSVESPPQEFGGKQIVMNSDRLLFNAKINEIMMFSQGSINVSTSTDFTFDVERDVVSRVIRNRYHETDGSTETWVKGDRLQRTDGNVQVEIGGFREEDIGERLVINVPQSFLGAESEDEPIPLGLSLADFLQKLVSWLDQHTHFSPVGPTGTPIPPLASIQLNAASANSIDNQINSDSHFVVR